MTEKKGSAPKGHTRRQVLTEALTGALGAAAVTALGTGLNGARAQPAPGGQAPIRIGVISDQSGPYSAPGGPGSVAGARLAAEDFAGKVLGRPVEILIGDHQNKPDVGIGIVRRWLDVDGVSAVADGGSSAVGLAIQELTRERKKLFLITGSTSSDLTGKACSPTGMQWQTDTYCTATAAVRGQASQNRKTWFFLTADYTFGYDLERYATAEIERTGGKVVGRSHFPLGTPDFSSVLLGAQSSGADVIALGASGSDAINAVKQAQEFGIIGKQAMVNLALYISDVEGLGHEASQGLGWITSFYWDRNDASRAWTKRFMALRNQLPTRLHAGTYSAVLHYLKAIETAGTEDGPTVAAKMRATPLQDSLFSGARIREDGRVMLPLFLMQNKKLADVKGPNDYASVVATVAPEQAYRPLSEGGCPYIAAGAK